MPDGYFSTQTFLQLAVILVACRVVGWFAGFAGQPQVVAEMVAGFLMGPSLLGWIAPSVTAVLFPTSSMPALYVLSQVGLALYMFCVGLEFRGDQLLVHGKRAWAVSAAGVVLPFALGGLIAVEMVRAGGFFTDKVHMGAAVLFLGASMSITAFPMLARILYERSMVHTPIGTLALAAGAMNDAAAWIILACVLGSVEGNGWIAGRALLGGLLYVAVTIFVLRPVFARAAAHAEAVGSLRAWIVSWMLAALALGAWFTDMVGIHAVFGAFVLGAAVPKGLMSRELQRLIEPLTVSLLVPLFFVYTGLRTQLALVDTPSLWAMAGVVFLAACIGKGVACGLAARLTGATTRDSLGVATLMNARGMMELVLVNIGLSAGLITPTLFAMLVVMAIGTTLLAAPCFNLLYAAPRSPAR
jgi:Kef-type K+ transport system membrane component KefB